MYYENELRYWIGLSSVPGIGKTRISALKKFFGLLKYAWDASAPELHKCGLDKKAVESIVAFRETINLDEQLQLIEKFNIKALPYEASQFPSQLLETNDCPAILYVRGDLITEDETSIAVVGTRKSTPYGRQVTEEITSNLARSGITIVSGLAKGIDTIAHRAALDAGGRTIAVFACGLDIVYPSENLNLARRIIGNGALVSEFPLGTKPKAEHFPRRNRILSGLSKGVLVVEAGEASGAMITVNFALEQNREVFAVPGSIFSAMSRGPNMLINEGAKVVRSHLDIIDELNLSAVTGQLVMKNVIASDEVESIIMSNITAEPLHVDEICRKTALDASTVMSHLAILELNGLVKNFGSMSYSLNAGLR